MLLLHYEGSILISLPPEFPLSTSRPMFLLVKLREGKKPRRGKQKKIPKDENPLLVLRSRCRFLCRGLMKTQGVT